MVHIKINVASGGVEHGTMTLPQLLSTAFGAGSSGQVFTSGGGAADPTWAATAAGSTSIESSQTVSFPAVPGTSYVISGSSNVTATLPTAVGITGQTVRLRCAKGYTGLLTIATTSSQTLGPSTAIIQILYAGETAVVQSDGANWARTGGVIIPCHAQLNLSTPQSIAAVTGVPVTLDTSVFDNTGKMNSTSGHTITAFRAGSYLVNVVGRFNAPDPTLGYTFITQARKNGTQALFAQIGLGVTGIAGNQLVGVSGTLVLAVGDALDVLVYFGPSTGTTALNLQGDASAANGPTFLEVLETPMW